MRTAPFKERFEDKIFYSPDGCWYWTGERLKIGYGRCYNNKTHDYAHRASYRLYKGDPDGMFVCHHCDNPLCVNPHHLFLGTPKDNMHDKCRKGRGSKPPISKPYVDLSGIRYGRLTVIERDKSHRKPYFWRCVCDCGAIKSVHHGHLRSGDTKSCGCLCRGLKIDERQIEREVKPLPHVREVLKK